MTNEIRGEVTLEVGETTYVFEPSFEAIASIETDLGRHALAILQELDTRDFGYREISTVLFHCRKDREVKRAQIGAAVFEVGLVKAHVPAMRLMLRFCTGPAAEDEEIDDSPKKSSASTGESSSP